LATWSNDVALRPGPAGVALARDALRALNSVLTRQVREAAHVNGELADTLADARHLALTLGVTSWDPRLDAALDVQVTRFAAGALSLPGSAGRVLGELMVANWQLGLVPYRPATARQARGRYLAALEAAAPLFPRAGETLAACATAASEQP
jgi:hypothetical protein